MSSSNPKSLEILLASLADLRLTLNETGGVQAVDANSGLLRHLSRDAMIGRPWLELVRTVRQSCCSGCPQRSLKRTRHPHNRMDVALTEGPEEEPIPMTCWLCTNADDNTVQLACVDLRGETNLRQQLVNAQAHLGAGLLEQPSPRSALSAHAGNGRRGLSGRRRPLGKSA